MNREEILSFLEGVEILKIIFSDSLIDINKVNIRKLNIKNDFKYQIEYFLENKAYHKNIEVNDILESIKEYIYNFKQILIVSTDKEFVLSLKKDKYKMKINENKKEIKLLDHNKKKKYFLNEYEEIDFLKELGIMSNDNKVYKKSYNKFRQINKYLEIISNVIDKMLKLGLIKDKINILDFGCGKSYLTFATYYYLKKYKKELKFNIVGLDLKKDVIENCNNLVSKLGYENINFLNEDIKDYKSNEVDLVFSLHACNNATDYSILKALELDAKSFLAVPCCHNEFYSNVKLNENLSFLKNDKIVLEKFCSLVTDTYRASFLEMCGYTTTLSEFIDMEYTPKNILITAIKEKNDKNYEKIEENYNKIKNNLGVNPILEKIAKKYIKKG